MNNPIGVHGLVWVGGWSEQQARHAIGGAREAGYDLVELLLMDPGAIDVAMTRRVLDEFGMRASGSLGLSPETDVSSDDDAVVARGREVLARAVDVAGEIGLEYLGGVIYGALTKYRAPVTPRGRANSVAAVAEMCARADGLPIGLEVVNRYESNLLNTARQAMAFIAETGAANLVVHLDTYHMNIEESGLFEPVLMCGDRLGYVHIGESHRGLLGSGTVDLDAFFRALRVIDYRGPITFESFSSAVVDPDLSYTLAIWRDLWTDSAELARHARGVIAGKLRGVDSIGDQ